MTTSITETEELYALRPAVHSVTERDGRVTLVAWPRSKALGRLSADQSAALRALAAGPQPLAHLAGDDEKVGGFLRGLLDGGWLSVLVRHGERRLYTIQPFGTPPARPPVRRGGGLSKFTVVRRHRGRLLMENPRSWCCVELHDPGVFGLVGGLAPQPPLPEEVAARVMTDLHWTGCTLANPEAEEAVFAQRQWSAHELWFHHRSTIGPRGWGWEPFGRTNWAKDAFDPLPAIRPSYQSEPVPLTVPDLEALRGGDASLTSVIEDRYSCRAFDEDHPITKDQLGELLYRCARTRTVVTVDGREFASRPYPSGGSAYELELYPVVRHVHGLPEGMYHYESQDHALRPVADGRSPAVGRQLRAASLTLADRQRPQVLIVIAARPGRLMWSYEQMAYALILKHVGALTQTLYLVATALGLGSVALGAGEGSAFTEATGTHDLEECVVGEFVVGSPAQSGRTRPLGMPPS
jgi:SagB-type dehydrogenase family enzyme